MGVQIMAERAGCDIAPEHFFDTSPEFFFGMRDQ